MSDGITDKAQLARTALGSTATSEAIRLTRVQREERETNSWFLDGVVWQQCLDCRSVQYPPRPLCSHCLSGALEWCQGAGNARLLASTMLHISFNDFYRLNAPWPCGMAIHDQGPVFYTFLESDALKRGDRLELYTAPDVAGQAVTIAVEPGADSVQRAVVLARRLI